MIPYLIWLALTIAACATIGLIAYWWGRCDRRQDDGLTAMADATHEPPAVRETTDPAPPGRNVHNPHAPALVTKSWPCGCQQTWDPFGRRLRHLGVTCEQAADWAAWNREVSQ